MAYVTLHKYFAHCMYFRLLPLYVSQCSRKRKSSLSILGEVQLCVVNIDGTQFYNEVPNWKQTLTLFLEYPHCRLFIYCYSGCRLANKLLKGKRASLHFFFLPMKIKTCQAWYHFLPHTEISRWVSPQAKESVPTPLSS